MVSEMDVGESARSRIAWRLLPFLFLLYVANYLDRTNIAYADARDERRSRPDRFRLRHRERNFFHWIFRAANSGSVVGRTLERATIAALTLITWGALTTLTGFVHTRASTLRRAFSARRGRGGIFSWCNRLSLALVHLPRPRPKPFARFMSAIPIGFIIGGPIAGNDPRVFIGLELAGWRWLFLFEGIPGGSAWNRDALRVCRIGLTRRSWLAPNERDWIDIPARRRTRAPRRTSSRCQIWQALRHPAVLMLTLVCSFTYTGGYVFWFWMPTMLQRLDRLE